MLKKMIARLLAVAMLLSLVPLGAVSGITVSAEKGEEYIWGDFRYVVADGKAIVTKYTGDDTAVDIPDKMDVYPVEEIGKYAFEKYNFVVSVTIPEGVKTIGVSAFEECTSLAWVEIPSTLENVQDYAFYHCSSLSSMTFPEGLLSIGMWAFCGTALQYVSLPESVNAIAMGAFYRCTSLRSITVDEDNKMYASEDGVLFNKDKTTLLRYPCGKQNSTYTVPSYVTAVDADAFGYCLYLTSVVIPDGVTSIGDRAFIWCSSLEDIAIPNSVTDIADYTFSNCASLTSVTIPDDVTTIGAYAFYECVSLQQIEIPDNVTEINECTFSGCTSLTNVTLPGGLTAVKSYAFYACKALEQIALPDDAVIGSSAFQDCSGLTSIAIPVANTCVAAYAFSGCTSLETVMFRGTVTDIGVQAFFGCSSLKTVVLPTGLGYIQAGAFGDCASLIDVVLPYTVYTIEAGAFANSSSFKYVYYSGSAEDRDFISIDSDNTELYNATWCYNALNDDFEYTVENGTAIITAYQGDAIGVVIPSYIDGYEVSGLADWAFLGHTALRSVVIPEGVTHIGNYAFFECTALNHVQLPKTVTSIGEKAFYRCYALATVSYGAMKEQRDQIDIGDGNESLLAAVWHCQACVGGAHTYDGVCDTMCDNCGVKRNTAEDHRYTDVCDEFCNGCGLFREVNYIQLDVETQVDITVNQLSKSFVFIPEESGKYTFYSKGDYDTYASVYDSQGNYMNSNDDGGQSFNFTVVAYMEAGTPYLLEATLYGGGINGMFTVAVEHHRHVYDTVCDSYCNTCNEYRAVTHAYDNRCDETCNSCGAIREAHEYTDVSDASCNLCGATRDVQILTLNTVATAYIDFDTTTADFVFVPNESGYYAFYAMGDNDTYGYILDGAGTVLSYNDDAGEGSNFCVIYAMQAGTPYVLRATYYSGWQTGSFDVAVERHDHVYDNACDTNCNMCQASRVAPHTYTNACDTSCNLCGATRTVKHSYSAATCSAPKTCKICGATSGSKLSHKSDKGTVTKAATCKATGTKTYKCTLCKAVIKTETIAKTTHKSDKGTVTKAATCKATGTKTYKCTLCKAVIKTETIAKKAHTYDSGKVTKKATCKATGVKTYTCKTCGAKKTSTIAKTTKHTYKTTTTKATLSKNGSIVKTCTVCGKVASKTTIKAVKTVTLSATEYTYNGKVKTPTVTVKTSAGKTLKKGKDYTVTYASGRKNVGTYKVTIKMKGNYSGTKTLTFKINPPKTAVSKLTAGKKAFTVSVTKKSGISGYQIQYSTSKSFAKATSKTITGTKLTVKNLKAAKTYYVRVRTYKTVNGKKVYSDWSAAKSVKTKT